MEQCIWGDEGKLFSNTLRQRRLHRGGCSQASSARSFSSPVCSHLSTILPIDFWPSIGEMPSLESLKLPSLSTSVLSFFSHLGINSVEDFLVQDIHGLLELAEHQLDAPQYKQAVADILLCLEEEHALWLDGVNILTSIQKNVSFLPTDCKSFDNILSGGFRDGTVTELFGSSSSGKTQICVQTAASAILHGGRVIYIDTCNSFAPSRLAEILCGLMEAKRGEEPHSIKEALKRIMCYRLHDTFLLLELLHQLNEHFNVGIGGNEEFVFRDTRLIVIDSISSIISPVLSSSYVQGHALMMKCGQILKKIASEKNLSILVTNHMVAGENRIQKPALGESWKVVPNVRLMVSRDAGSEVCSVSLMKHSSMSCNKKAFFRLTAAGMQSI